MATGDAPNAIALKPLRREDNYCDDSMVRVVQRSPPIRTIG